MRFLNRSRELGYFHRLMEVEPNSIVFCVGPRSCGKSTLIRRVVEEKAKEADFDKRYAVYWFDFRGLCATSTSNPVSVFFERGRRRRKDGSLREPPLFRAEGGIFEGFLVDPQVLERLQAGDLNPFRFLLEKLRYNVRRGRVNLVVLDEIQMLQNAYLSKGSPLRQFVEELLNLLVLMTKVEHIAHCWVVSNNALFVEDLFMELHMDRCFNYYLLDHLEKGEALRLLSELGFGNRECMMIWDVVGGDLWAWNEVLSGVQVGLPLPTVLSDLQKSALGVLRRKMLSLKAEDPKLYEGVKAILQGFVFLERAPLEAPFVEWSGVRWLVENDVLFYNPVEGVVSFHSPLTLSAARNLVAPG